MNTDKIQEFVTRAEKLEKTKGFLEYISSGITVEKYETIADLYEKAANIAKLSDPVQAIEYYTKSYIWASKVSDEFNELKIKNLLVTIGDLYASIDWSKSIEYYTKVIDYYTEQGGITQICKFYEKIAKLYLDNNELTQATDILCKLIDIGLSDSKTLSYVTKARQSLGSVYVKQGNYLQAGMIYWTIGMEELGNRFSSSGAKKHFFKSIICMCAGGDYTKANDLFIDAHNRDYTWTGSSSSKFISKLLKAIESIDIETFEEVCGSYDEITPLDPDQVHLLLQIKKQLELEFESEQTVDLS